jgi:hypothetical protein
MGPVIAGSRISSYAKKYEGVLGHVKISTIDILILLNVNMGCNMSFKKSITILFVLLILLNILIRIPSVPHENGNDSFMLHTLANSVTQFGEAKWWLNTYSVFGMYSYSYGSALPFLLSGIQQLTNIEMETSVWVMSVPLGLISMFSAFIMAGEIKRDFSFKFIFALFYSVSQGVLQFTVWNGSSRGIFLVLLPLFIYILIKENVSVLKKTLLLLMLFVYLRSAHNFSYFLVPVVGSYILSVLFIKYDLFNLNDKYSRYYHFIYIAILFSAIFVPFLTGLFIVGSRYQAFFSSFITMTRYTGPLIFFAFAGLMYLIFKQDKNHKDWFILIVTAGFTPMFYSLAYGPFILLIPAIYLISISFSNLFLMLNKSKLIHIIVIGLILSSVAFSSYYMHFRTGSSTEGWYMDDRTNVAGIWTRSAFEENTRILTPGGETWRMTAIANGHAVFPTIPPVALAYGFVSEEEVLENTLTSELVSTAYFFDGPYVQKDGTDSWGKYAWISYFDIEDKRTINLIEEYDLKYAAFDTYVKSTLESDIDSRKNKIYDNSRIKFYPL